MEATGVDSGASAATTLPWRNPWIVAFVFGALVLTVLPLLQRQMLSAPDALASLGTWSLSGIDGPSIGSTSLGGKAWLASFVPSPCNEACVQDLELFGRSLSHLADLGGRVAMVSFIEPGAEDAARRARPEAAASWHLLRDERAGSSPVRERFRAAWSAQTQRLTAQTIPFLARPTYAVVDQRGDVRGFWPADEEGRGHAINAVRMFARHGAEP